jgi:hypothetical protein
MHALLFVSMGVEARCHPSKSTAHCHHMKRQPFLCNGHPHCGRCHCHYCCHCRLHHRHHHHCPRNRPSPLPLTLLSTIAVAVAIDHCHRHLCRVLPSAIAVAITLAISHCCLRHRQPSQLPLPLAITVAMPLAISESCCLGVEKLHSTNQRKECLWFFILFRQWAVH